MRGEAGITQRTNLTFRTQVVRSVVARETIEGKFSFRLSMV